MFPEEDILGPRAHFPASAALLSKEEIFINFL